MTKLYERYWFCHATEELPHYKRQEYTWPELTDNITSLVTLGSDFRVWRFHDRNGVATVVVALYAEWDEGSFVCKGETIQLFFTIQD